MRFTVVSSAAGIKRISRVPLMATVKENGTSAPAGIDAMPVTGARMPVLKIPTSGRLWQTPDLPFQSMAARSVSARGSDMPTLRVAWPQ